MSTQSTNQPLAVRPQAPAAFGSRDEIQAIADRISVMLPSARLEDWQLKRDDRAALQKKLDESIYRAAQLSVFYRLVPGEDVHVIPFGNNWAVDMGIETWKKAADRYCSLHGMTYHIVTEEMSVEELKERRGTDYHPNDCGMVAYLWRSDKKDVYEIFGAKQSMSRAAGIWRQHATQKKDGKWLADTIPSQRSKQDVAKRRAMKAVLKLEFSLDSLLAATPDQVRDSVSGLDSRLKSEERRTALPAPRVEYDEDGLDFDYPRAQRTDRRDLKFIVVDEDGVIEHDAGAEEMPEPPQNDTEAQSDAVEAAVDYLALGKRLQGMQAQFATWTRQAHANSNGAASVDQYRFLVGTLNRITGDKESHRLLLGAMLGRHVDSSNTPGIYAVTKLLEWLTESSVDEITGDSIRNPHYRADYVECVREMYAALTANTAA